jgi:serine/threonine-protein kinase RsbW
VGTQKLGMMGRLDQSDTVSDPEQRSRFVRSQVHADACSASQARTDFAAWLQKHFTLSPERFSDVLLAVNEAIANAAEFAYVDAPEPGTVDVSAAYDDGSDTLAVTITDRGRWRHDVPPELAHQLRGRGLPLMEALADEVAIARAHHGTRVTLTWNRLTIS